MRNPQYSTAAAAPIRELTAEELDLVAGGNKKREIAYLAISTWTSGVAGFAIGSTVPGIGNVVGAIGGGLLGLGIGVGFMLSSPTGTSSGSTAGQSGPAASTGG